MHFKTARWSAKTVFFSLDQNEETDGDFVDEWVRLNNFMICIVTAIVPSDVT